MGATSQCDASQCDAPTSRQQETRLFSTLSEAFGGLTFHVAVRHQSLMYTCTVCSTAAAPPCPAVPPALLCTPVCTPVSMHTGLHAVRCTELSPARRSLALRRPILPPPQPLVLTNGTLSFGTGLKLGLGEVTSVEADLLAFELNVATSQGAVHIRVFSSDAMQATSPSGYS